LAARSRGHDVRVLLIAATALVAVVGGLNLGESPALGPLVASVAHSAPYVRTSQAGSLLPTESGSSRSATAPSPAEVGFGTLRLSSSPGGNSQVELNLLNGSRFVSPSLLYTGELGDAGTVDSSFPVLLTGASTSEFWPSAAPVLMMTPSSSGHDSGLFLYSAPSGNDVSLKSVGVGYPGFTGDGLENYLFLQPLGNTSWDFPYVIHTAGNNVGTAVGSVMFPYSSSPDVVIQWDPYWNSVNGSGSGAFNLFLVSPEPNGSVGNYDVDGFGALGSDAGVTPNPGDYLEYDVWYSSSSNVISATLTDENVSGVNYSLSVNLSRHSFAPGVGTPTLYDFGVGGSTGTIDKTGWGLLYNSFTSHVGNAVRFTETGLPAGTRWWMNVSGESSLNSTTDTISTSLPSGTYDFTVGSANKSWAAPRSTFSVDGAALSLSVTFTQVTYIFNIYVDGLPRDAGYHLFGWSYNATFSTFEDVSCHRTCDGLAIGYGSWTNGSFPYLMSGPAGYRLSGMPGEGNITTRGNTNITFQFVRGPTYKIDFTETGLSAGTKWCVQFGWISCSSTRSMRAGSLFPFPRLNLAPGRYTYSIEPIGGNTITARIGQIAVPTSGVIDLTQRTKVAIAYSYPYELFFAESGLTTGYWSVTIKGQTHYAPWNRTIEFNLTNGTYGYRVGGETGFTGSGNPAKAVIRGGGATVAVTYRPL
jgi:hypothetical protein